MEMKLTCRPGMAQRNSEASKYGVWCGVYGMTERGFHALWRSATPKPTLPRPARAHQLGYIIMVLQYGQGCAFSIFWVGYPLQDGSEKQLQMRRTQGVAGVAVAQDPTGIIIPKPEMCWDPDPSTQKTARIH